MPDYTDVRGNNLSVFKTPPRRIVSLVPSQTELLYDLGLDKEVVGITKFCVHPTSWFQSKTRIGGTKNINLDKIKVLQPDLILANKEENVKEQIEELANHFPVWVTDVNNLKEALDMIEAVGILTNKTATATHIKNGIAKNFDTLKQQLTFKPIRTCYLIWKDPYMTVGGDTFIHNMLQHAGFENIFSNKQRYPEVTLELLQTMNCEVMLLSSEPYPFSEKHIAQLQLLLPKTRIMLVDGEMFSWYGSRLMHAPAYFTQLQVQLQNS